MKNFKLALLSLPLLAFVACAEQPTQLNLVDNHSKEPNEPIGQRLCRQRLEFAGVIEVDIGLGTVQHGQGMNSPSFSLHAPMPD